MLSGSGDRDFREIWVRRPGILEIGVRGPGILEIWARRPGILENLGPAAWNPEKSDSGGLGNLSPVAWKRGPVVESPGKSGSGGLGNLGIWVRRPENGIRRSRILEKLAPEA